MCGIAGLWTWDAARPESRAAERVARMSDRMRRRGPDDHGTWQDERSGLRLAHRRLAVIDTTSAAHQPMVSATGRSVLVYNGELYNFRELREKLEAAGRAFRSQGDTEVLLAALETWGRDALTRLNGMFAFAWYDRDDASLLLARDHAGIKPLYYAADPSGRGFGFASQLDALLEMPWVDLDAVEPGALRLLLQFGYVPAPYGLLRNTRQLEPGQWLQVSRDHTLRTGSWWRASEGTRADLSLEALDECLHRVVARQRIADVPLGVFLSGGIDSPLVTAVARRQVGSGLKTFTVSNPGWSQDEGRLARAYADHLGVDAYDTEASSRTVEGVWDDLVEAQSEPMGDFSILPTLAVSALARREVTVALSGDGGDELFFGYERPFSLLRTGHAYRWPRALRVLRYALGRLRLLPAISDVVVHPDAGAYYESVNTRLPDAALRSLAPDVAAAPEGFALYRSGRRWRRRDLAAFSRHVEYHGQLQRILRKVDMASMHYSLEVRVPVLDREIVELAFSLDATTLVSDGVRKKPLRDLLGRYVPPATIPQPKLGFAVPLDEWLAGPLSEVAQSYLLDGPLYPEGLFEPDAVRAYWQGFLAGDTHRKWGLWVLLSLQSWARRQADMLAP